MWPFRNGSTTSRNGVPASAPPQRRQPTPQEEIDQAIAEMASNHLAKESKLTLAQNAVMLQDLQQLSATEHRDVRYLKAKRLQGPWQESLGDGQAAPWGGTAEEEMNPGILICDDYHYNDRPQVVQARPSAQTATPWIVAAVAVVLAAALGGAVLAACWNRPTPPPSPAPSPTPITQRIENHDGFLIELVPATPVPMPTP